VPWPLIGLAAAVVIVAAMLVALERRARRGR
jgi:hypothetical protein